MRSILAWFHGWWNAEDRTQDVKLAAFFLVVLAAIVWLSVDLRKAGITPAWVDAFAWLCALVGIGGAGWAAVEKWRGGKGASQPAKAPGSPGEGREP